MTQFKPRILWRRGLKAALLAIIIVTVLDNIFIVAGVDELPGKQFALSMVSVGVLFSFVEFDGRRQAVCGFAVGLLIFYAASFLARLAL